MKTKESIFDYLKRIHSKVQIFYYFGGNTFLRLYSFCITEHVSVFILPKQRYKSKSCLWLSYLIYDHSSTFILLSWQLDASWSLSELLFLIFWDKDWIFIMAGWFLESIYIFFWDKDWIFIKHKCGLVSDCCVY